MEVPNSTPTSGRDVKPIRIWEDRKTFTAVTDACIANDTIVISTRSGHVYVRSRKKELTSIKGFELRGGGAGANNIGKRGLYKFTRIWNLQRVVNVAVSSSGGFAAIRADAPLLSIRHAGESLSDSLLGLLPHYRRLAEENRMMDGSSSASLDNIEAQPQALDDDDDESIEYDICWLDKICRILTRWDPTWSSTLSAGSDILVVAERGGIKVPAQSALLAARSLVLADALRGQRGGPLKVEKSGTTTLLLPKCSHITVLLLLHYLYSDAIPAIYDGRLYAKMHSAYPALQLQVADIKSELHNVAQLLQLPSLLHALRSYGKAIPPQTLGEDLVRLSFDHISADVVLEADGRDLRCHSVVLRSRSPFFAVSSAAPLSLYVLITLRQAMFDDPDWYAPRTESDPSGSLRTMRIDMKHIDADILQLVLTYIYADSGTELFKEFKASRIEEKLDHIMLVMSAANELLLDRLKSLCSIAARPLGMLRQP